MFKTSIKNFKILFEQCFVSMRLAFAKIMQAIMGISLKLII